MDLVDKQTVFLVEGKYQEYEQSRLDILSTINSLYGVINPQEDINNYAKDIFTWSLDKVVMWVYHIVIIIN